MHPAPVFEWADREAMLAFVAERAFAMICAPLDGRIAIAQAPVIVDDDREHLLLHLSRGNPLARALPLRAVFVVAGPDAYISPDWYATPDQVPTWNYVSVELEGELREVPVEDVVRRQSAVFEARIAGKRPWTIDKMTPSVAAAKLRGIVGVRAAIDAIRGTRKLSQNKSDDDLRGVTAALGDGDAAMRAVAALMKR